MRKNATTASHARGSSQQRADVILGSASPRRAELLRQAGFDFIQQHSPLDEAACDLAGLSVAEQVRTLAEAKARSLADHLTRGAERLLLTADTLLSLDDAPLGKPTDAAHARRMLESLVGRTHQVLTGVCLLDPARPDAFESFVDAADVTLGPLPDDELTIYIDSGAWQGKAGGYNLAELENRWRFEVTGDPTTVVGLPMNRLAPLLRQRLAEHA